MILYLSPAIENEIFAGLVVNRCLTGGYQSQRFNSLVIEGLNSFTQVEAVGKPSYNHKLIGSFPAKTVGKDNTVYHIIGTKRCCGSTLRRLLGFREIFSKVNSIVKNKNQCIEGIICDAINPLMALTSVLLAKRRNIPSVAIVTDLPETMTDNPKGFWAKLTSYLMKKFDAYVFLTEQMNEVVNKSKKPYIVVEGLCDAKEENNNERRYEEYQNDPFVFLYSGALRTGVGIEQMVNAFAQTSCANVELHIYGDGSLRTWIENNAKTSSKIKYGGIRTNKEVVEFQKKASVLVNPRPQNVVFAAYSFPSKLMEYMVSGVPVLTTRLSGIPQEYFEHALILEDVSPNVWQNTISQILSTNRKELFDTGKRAREFVLCQKNNVVQAKKIYNLLKML